MNIVSNNQNITKERDNTLSLKLLLANNPDYSKVLSLQEFLTVLEGSNPVYNSNIKEMYRLIKQGSFYSFLSKGIICFQASNTASLDFLISQISGVDSVTINSNFTLLNILNETLRNQTNESNNVQMFGKRQPLITDNQNTLLKNFSNRLINTKNFELLRLCIGDIVLFFMFRLCSLYLYDEQAMNYIQVLGDSLKEITRKLLNVPKENYSNRIFQKVFTCTNTQPVYPLKKNYSNSKDNLNRIPHNHPFNVERNKIYYCPNFNRKLGFFHKLHFGAKNFGLHTYEQLFNNIKDIIPLDIKEEIIKLMNEVGTNIKTFNYYKTLYRFCPLINDWKKIKKESLEKIKQIESLTNESDKTARDDINAQLMEILKQLINSNIPFDNINRFVCCFITAILPSSLLGGHNLTILKKKINQFIALNRFENFNKINLFDKHEFSFVQMKWLNLKMSKKSYSEIGILLKNHIMKSIIFFVFDYILVQLFRSHFFITEKQGDHFKSFYYHKTIYDLIMKICYVKYLHISKQYKFIDNHSAYAKLKSIESAPGRLRLMPKPTTMRPITSFKKKIIGTNKGYLKAKLFETQKIFKLIQSKMQRNQQNCVVFDYKEIIKRLMTLKQKLKGMNTNSQLSQSINDNKNLSKYLSYVTMDIEACYDNIDITLLDQFLTRDNTISSTYVLGILYVIIPRPHVLNHKTIELKECFDVKLAHIVSDLNDYIHVLDHLQKREDMTYKNCILYLDTSMKYMNKENFMPFVQEIVANNIIKFNRNFLQQIKGIPQGLSISSFLCNLFFYEIEQNISIELQKNNAMNSNILLRFMDDYLCMSTHEEKAMYFKSNAVDLSFHWKFNFNLKKSQTNLIEQAQSSITPTTENSGITSTSIVNHKTLVNPKIPIIPLIDTQKTKFIWNGIYFELNNNDNIFFNLIYDAKASEDISEYCKLINVNLPILKNVKDYTWLIKKINTILFSGHPWIYFLSSVNEEEVLRKNFECFCRFVTLKLMVLVNKLEGTQLEPSQRSLIEILDTCFMKMYSFFDTKIYDIEGKRFFIPFGKFHRTVYIIIFKNFFIDQNTFNIKMIHYAKQLFLAVKRKLEHLKQIKSVRKDRNEFNEIRAEINNILDNQMDIDE